MIVDVNLINLHAFETSLSKSLKNNATRRIPSAHLAIDKSLYPYKSRIGIKQYKTIKQAKYGLLHRSLCDSLVQYAYFSLAYGDNPSQRNDTTSRYYVTGADEYTRYLLNEASKYYKFKECNVLGKGYLIYGRMR